MTPTFQMEPNTHTTKGRGSNAVRERQVKKQPRGLSSSDVTTGKRNAGFACERNRKALDARSATQRTTPSAAPVIFAKATEGGR